MTRRLQIPEAQLPGRVCLRDPASEPRSGGCEPFPRDLPSERLSNTPPPPHKPACGLGGRAVPPLTSARRPRGCFLGLWQWRWAFVAYLLGGCALFALLVGSLFIGAALQ